MERNEIDAGSIVAYSFSDWLLDSAPPLQHNKTAVQVKEDMKKMVQMPILRKTAAAKHTKLFGTSLFELQEKGLVQDGVPLVVQRMVEHLGKHGEEKPEPQWCLVTLNYQVCLS